MADQLTSMNDFERRAMELILGGDHPHFDVLRSQAMAASVTSRKYTGVGFFTSFDVPVTCPRLPPSRARWLISDVHGEAEGVEHGVGFILFVDDGALGMLECYTYGTESLAPEARLLRVYYMRHPDDTGSLVECPVRDLTFALSGSRPSA
jgi:hypothetical protein